VVSGKKSRPATARPSKPVRVEKSSVRPADAVRQSGDDFGLEGTNKTVATPKSDNAAPDELGLGPHIEKSPYTRG